MHAIMKHVEIDFHFVRDLIAEGTLDVRYTPAEEQVTDALSKPLSWLHFSSLRIKLMVVLEP